MTALVQIAANICLFLFYLLQRNTAIHKYRTIKKITQKSCSTSLPGSSVGLKSKIEKKTLTEIMRKGLHMKTDQAKMIFNLSRLFPCFSFL